MTTATALSSPSDLQGFTGTEQWYRHGLNRKFIYTDGVRYFAENAGGGAYWFLDIAASSIFMLHRLQKEEFLSVTMTVTASGAVILVTDGNDEELFTQHIEFTDCPQGEWKFFQIWDGENSTMLLLSEY